MPKGLPAKKSTDLQIAYIGGGSRGWAWGLMGDLAAEADLSGVVRLYDIDHQAAKDNVLIGNSLKDHPDAVGKWTYEHAPTLAGALKGTDIVVISILPGTFDEMESDVHAPEKFGIFQSVGDTCGPGGAIRALRTVPVYEEFAEAIGEHGPEAWVINYTNPMAVCVRTLSEVFPAMKAFGCCHEVFGTQDLLRRMLKSEHGVELAHRSDVRINVLGVNHFTWITQASTGEIDLMPLWEAFSRKHWKEGFESRPGEWKNGWFSSANRIKMDLTLRFGALAAAGDRHLAEFFGPRYLADPQTAASWKFTLTPVSWRKAETERIRARAKAFLSGKERIGVRRSGEEGVSQIKAILGLGDMVTNVNMPNVGQAPGWKLGAVVETNARFTRDSVRPIHAGELPPAASALVEHHINIQGMLVQAGLEKDVDLAFRAFMAEPACACLAEDDGWALFRQMLRATRKFLPGWKLPR